MDIIEIQSQIIPFLGDIIFQFSLYPPPRKLCLWWGILFPCCLTFKVTPALRNSNFDRKKLVCTLSLESMAEILPN